MSLISRRSMLSVLALIPIAWGASTAVSTAAPPASETLLPARTKGYVSVPDVAALIDSFEATQFGQLLADPVMQPFADDLKVQIRERLSISKDKLGVTWDDLQGVVAGELTLAIIQPQPKPMPKAKPKPGRRKPVAVSPQAVLALIADVTGRAEQTEALLKKIDADLLERGATKKQKKIAGVSMTVFKLPKPKGKVTQRFAIYFFENDLLVACDNEQVIGGIASRISAPGEVSGTLAGVPAYQMITKRCRGASGELAPQIRWFLEPFGYIESMRSAANDGKPKKGKKMLTILQAQGFDAIKGLGGFVNLREDRYDLLHRTFIYAPGEDGKKGPAKVRFRLAARMLQFPSGGDLEPQSFVPRDVSSYGSLHFDVKNAFDSVGTLVDAVIGEPGIWPEIIEGLKNDPDGPQVDVEKNIIGQLANRLTLISANQEPIGPDSERLVLVVDVKDKAAELILAKAIEKMMKDNPTVKKRIYKGRVIWEVTPAEAELPMIEIVGPGVGLLSDEDDEDEDEEDGLGVGDTSAITISDGQLIIASHLDMLKKILDTSKAEGGLAQALDYQLVNARLKSLTAGCQSIKFFSRTDEEYRVNYEMLRRGKMPEAKTVMGQILNALLGEGGRKKTVRKAKIDGAKLPSYDVVRRYLGPAGLAVTTEQDGWMITGFTLDKRKAELTSRVKPLEAAPK